MRQPLPTPVVTTEWLMPVVACQRGIWQEAIGDLWHPEKVDRGEQPSFFHASWVMLGERVGRFGGQFRVCRLWVLCISDLVVETI